MDMHYIVSQVVLLLVIELFYILQTVNSLSIWR